MREILSSLGASVFTAAIVIAQALATPAPTAHAEGVAPPYATLSIAAR